MKVLKVTFVNFLVLFLLVVFMQGPSFALQDKMRLLSEEEIISLSTDSDNQQVFYAASEEKVYKTIDGGSSWQKIFNIRQANKKINEVYAGPNSIESIYVLTREGLYRSSDQGRDWKKVFKGGSDLEGNCLSMLKTSKAIFLGTEEGLFTSQNQGKTWQKTFDHFSDSVVSLIEGSDKIVYLATEKGVFVSEDNGKSWERIYVTYRSEIPSEDYSDYDGDVSDQVLNIKSMAISSQGLYIATAKGLFSTNNKGKKWKSLTKIGLPSLNIRSMTVSRDEELYVASDKGIFQLGENRWQRVGDRSLYKNFSDLSIDKEGVLLIAGTGGVYKLNIKEEAPKDGKTIQKVNYNKQDIEKIFEGEPTIEQVQKAAIKYSETNINKIYSWRRQSRLKALFPSFSVGYDKVIYGSSSGAMAIGPRDWDMNISWDLADFIWSSDQTSIDSRSRLTVQLRQDILDQVTNLYFERKRLKAEFLLSPPEDEVEKLYRNLEIQQVTADLDGLTNNFFSRFMQKNKENSQKI